MTIPDEDSEASQTGKYCLVAIGRLQVCIGDVSPFRLYGKLQDTVSIHNSYDKAKQVSRL